MASVLEKIKETFKGKPADQEPSADTTEDEGDTLEEGLDDLTLAEGGDGQEGSRADIERVDVELPKEFKGKLAFVLYNVFSEKECQELIKKTEKMGYIDALVNVGYGRERAIPEVRNNKRCIWDSPAQTDRIWKRIEPYVPSMWAKRKVMGLNERLRFLKYVPGQYFKEHMDGEYRRENGERSFITIQLYLNEGFKGGSTTFLSCNLKDRFEVVPKTGSVLVFQHDILHEGSELKKGTKYTVRTDVMYDAKITET